MSALLITPQTNIGNVADAASSGADDTLLDAVISDYLNDSLITATVSEWRIANYASLRRWTYPDKADFLDAQVKNCPRRQHTN